MLTRLSTLRAPSTRLFSGSDPYWLHLKQQPDKYPQYAHLHWHTCDPLEVGKYAKYRSKHMYGDHVSEDPHHVEWEPEVHSLNKATREMRDLIYEKESEYGGIFLKFMDTFPDLESHHEGDTLAHGANDMILTIIKPKQIEEAHKLAKKLVAEYTAAGVPFTRQSISSKVSEHFLHSLSNHQVHDIQHGMLPYLTKFGLGLPMNED